MLETTNHLTVHVGIDRHSTINSSQGSTQDKQCGDRFGAEHVMSAQKIMEHILHKLNMTGHKDFFENEVKIEKAL